MKRWSVEEDSKGTEILLVISPSLFNCAIINCWLPHNANIFSRDATENTLKPTDSPEDVWKNKIIQNYTRVFFDFNLQKLKMTKKGKIHL